MPVEYRKPIQYTWIVGVKELNKPLIDEDKYKFFETDVEQHLTIFGVMQADSIITCIISEQNSSLYQQTTLLLEIKGK